MLLAGAVVLPLALAPLLLQPKLAIVFVVAVVMVSLASRSVVYPVALAGLPSVVIGLSGGANPLPTGLVTMVIFGWIAAAIGLAALRSEDELPLHVLFAPVVLATVLLAIWLVARLGPSLDPSYGSRKLQLFVAQNLVLLVAGIVIARKPGRVELWVFVALLMAVLSSLVLTHQLMTGQTTGGVEGRVSLTQADNPILLGRDAARGLLLAVFVLLASRVAWLRLVALGAIPVIAVSFFAAGSRGPVIGLLVGLVVLLALTVRDAAARRRVVLVVLGAIAAVALVPQLVPGGDIGRTLSIFSGTGEGVSSNGRSHLWSLAWSLFTSHPLTGIGTGSFAAFGGIFASYPHNILLEAAAELGVVGLVLVGGVLVFSVAQVARIFRVADGVDRMHAALIAALLASAIVNALLSGDLTVNSTVWLSAGLVVGLGRRTGALLPAFQPASMMRARKQRVRTGPRTPRAPEPATRIESPGRIVEPVAGARVGGNVDVVVEPARLRRPLDSIRLEWSNGDDWREVARSDERTFELVLDGEPFAVVRSQDAARALADTTSADVVASRRHPWSSPRQRTIGWDAAGLAGEGELRAVTRDVEGAEAASPPVALALTPSAARPDITALREEAELRVREAAEAAERERVRREQEQRERARREQERLERERAAAAVTVPPAPAARPTLAGLQAVVAAAPVDDERRFELEAMLFYLQDFVEQGGVVPERFDGLVDEYFGDLMGDR